MAFGDRAHQVDSTARSIVFIAGGDVGGTRFETKPAVNAGKELFFVLLEQQLLYGPADVG